MKATKKIPHAEDREKKVSGKQKKVLLQEARERKKDKEPDSGDNDEIPQQQQHSESGGATERVSDQTHEPSVSNVPRQEVIVEKPLSEKARMKKFAFSFYLPLPQLHLNNCSWPLETQLTVKGSSLKYANPWRSCRRL